MLTISLSIKDRLVLGNILPHKGDIRTMIIVEDIRKKIMLTQAEIELINFTVDGDSYKWDPKKSPVCDISFTDIEKDVLIERFNELDKEKEITSDILILYRLFK